MNGPWDPRVLERVRHLHLHARQAVAGLWHGTQRSIHTGHDVEFADYKPYDFGDSLRDVDWRVLARTDRLVVRRYRAETELPVMIVLDASGDLGSTPAKLDMALRTAATMAYLLHLDGEPVGLAIGAGEGVPIRRLPPRRGRRHLAQLFLLLASVRPAGRAGLDSLFREVGAHLGARSLVVVVSDFMEEPSTWIGSLAALTRNRVDLRAFHVWDPAELELRYDAPLKLRSPETNEELPVDPAAARALFGEVVREFFTEVRTAVQARRGRHYDVPVGADLAAVLARFLEGGA
ncbi:MAG: DUF58 domain-containing protein [Pseudomonadota bacterium]|nr:DUF58 domain-containing protein [Pseudomonadota bacterium]